MLTQPTVKDHYKALKTRNLEIWNELNAELARHQKLTHFLRSVCGNPGKSLPNIDWITCNLMIKYLGFRQENFDRNEIPALPEGAIA